MVTNEHVIRGVGDLRIRLYDGRELAACVAGADPATDIALVKIKPKGTLPVLPLGDSDAVRVGEPVIAIGNPFGFNHSVTAGIVSAKERVVDRSTLREPKQQDMYSFFIQTDASINLGNSGGPLIDAGGAVIGVSAAFWAGHPLQPAQGIGFAIPINMAKALLPRLAKDGSARRSFLGVDAQPLDPALEGALKLTSGRGALIASVEKGSPAEAAGLEPGDVVLSWNGAAVVTSEDLKINAQLAIPGSHAKLALVRDGKRIERDVVLRAATVKGVAPPHPASCAQRREPTMAARRGLRRPGAGAGARERRCPAGGASSVTRITDHGAADQAGLKVGDIVLRIGKASVRTPADVATVARRLQTGRHVADARSPQRFRLLDGILPEMTSGAMDEKRYRDLLDDAYARVDRAFEDVDPDVAEVSISQGTLTITFFEKQRLMLTPAAVAPAAVGRVPRPRLALQLGRGEGVLDGRPRRGRRALRADRDHDGQPPGTSRSGSRDPSWPRRGAACRSGMGASRGRRGAGATSGAGCGRGCGTAGG